MSQIDFIISKHDWKRNTKNRYPYHSDDIGYDH